MKKLFIGALAALMMPTNAWAALCPFPDGPATKCEIPLCVQAGFPSSDGCRPALKVFIKRIFKRKPPVPLPPECMCTWIPQVVIPTDKNGVPFFISDSLPFGSAPATVQYASAAVVQQTPFEKPVQPRLDQPMNMTPYEKVAATTIKNPTEEQVRARTAKVIREQNVYRTNCNSAQFRSRKSGSCFIITGGERIDINVNRKRYKRIPRRYKYDYKITARQLDGTGDVHMTHMRIRHKTMQYCQTFKNGRPTSDANCGENLPAIIADPTIDPDPLPTPGDTPGTLPGTGPGTTPGTSPDVEIQKSKPENNGVLVFE